jgi:hypothetical protein
MCNPFHLKCMPSLRLIDSTKPLNRLLETLYYFFTLRPNPIGRAGLVSASVTGWMVCCVTTFITLTTEKGFNLWNSSVQY